MTSEREKETCNQVLPGATEREVRYLRGGVIVTSVLGGVVPAVRGVPQRTQPVLSIR